MTEKKLSRRDAMKLLGTAIGAAALSTLPPAWSKPVLATSQLPEHAQQSLCMALFVEVISGDGSFDGTLAYGTWPDSTSGTGAVGTTLTWLCQSGCNQSRWFLTAGTSVLVRFTTLTSQFDLNFTAGTPIHSTLVDLGTGQYALDGVGSAGGCLWQQNNNAPEGARPNAGSFFGNQ